MPGNGNHQSIPLPTGQRLDVFEQALAPQWRCQWDDQDLLTVELTDGIARVVQCCQESTQLLRAAWAFLHDSGRESNSSAGTRHVLAAAR